MNIMALRDDWKQTGSGLGHAFGSLGSSVVDTVKGQPSKNEWKAAGKGLGGAFANLGKSIVKSTKVAVDHIDDKMSQPDEQAQTGPVQEEQTTPVQEEQTAPVQEQENVLTDNDVEVLPPQ